VEGLRTGEADTNNDGRITLDDLHSYLFKQVSEHSDQRPVKTDLDQEGPPIVIGWNRKKVFLSKLNDVQNRINSLWTSSFIDKQTFDEWHDFTAGFDPAKPELKQLVRLDILSGLLQEHVRPSQVIRAWDRANQEQSKPPTPPVAPPAPQPHPAPTVATPSLWKRAAIAACSFLLLALGFGAGWFAAPMHLDQQAQSRQAIRERDQAIRERAVAINTRVAAESARISAEQQRDATRAQIAKTEQAQRGAELARRTAEKERDDARAQLTKAPQALAEYRCDVLAADDYDPSRTDARQVGVPFSQLESYSKDKKDTFELAVSSCKQAFEATKEKRYQFQLGRLLLASGDSSAERILIEAASGASGYPAAMTILGLAYRGNHPNAISKNDSQARSWYEKAIAARDPAAMIQRAYMRGKQEYNEQDTNELRKLLEMASDRSIHTNEYTKLSLQAALMFLGDFYGANPTPPTWIPKRTPTPKDCDRAKAYYKQAADVKGDPLSTRLLLALESYRCGAPTPSK
jgi:TPR repeat protein